MPSYRFCPLCGEPLVESEAFGRTRRMCGAESCDYVFWDNPVPVVAGIVSHDSGVLLVRNKGWPAKWFGLVTGFLERDETPEDGVLREVKEELGLDATIVEFVGVYPFFQMNQLILVFHLKATGEIVLGEEIEAFKAVPVEKLRPWPMGTGPAVRDWLERQDLSNRS